MTTNEAYLRLLFVAAVAVIVAFMVGTMAGKGSFDAVKDWQTVIGALVASVAVGVAYVNVIAKCE